VTPRGNKYFLLLVDDLSRYMWVVTIPYKDRAAAVIKDIQVRAKGESGLKLKALRTNYGGEFTVTELAEYCAAEGVHHQHTTPSQQNGVVPPPLLRCGPNLHESTSATLQLHFE
jgi:hypothetical protein